MRDPDRLRSITQLIRDIWSYFPEWRFFQLMMNIEWTLGINPGPEDWTTIGAMNRRWSIDDDATEHALEGLLRRIENGSGRWPD